MVSLSCYAYCYDYRGAHPITNTMEDFIEKAVARQCLKNNTNKLYFTLFSEMVCLVLTVQLLIFSTQIYNLVSLSIGNRLVTLVYN